VQDLVPGLTTTPEGHMVPDPAVAARLDEERDRRLNRYFWEGGFFLAVLVAAVAMLWRAVHEEAELRRRQQNFLAAVSHELKSPIATSRIAAETLEMRELPAPERRRLVGRILRNLARLEGMVVNLLDTARIEAGAVAVSREPIDLAPTLASTLAAFEERAESEGVLLEVTLPGGLTVVGDAEAARTIVRNLVENAFEAVSQAQEPTVRVRARSIDGVVHLEVEDNGAGFATLDGEKLFEKFYRPGDEMRRGGRGVGLGLYIVRELASRSGALVSAWSAGPGKGATFTVDWSEVQR